MTLSLQFTTVIIVHGCMWGGGGPSCQQIDFKGYFRELFIPMTPLLPIKVLSLSLSNLHPYFNY